MVVLKNGAPIAIITRCTVLWNDHTSFNKVVSLKVGSLPSSLIRTSCLLDQAVGRVLDLAPLQPRTPSQGGEPSLPNQCVDIVNNLNVSSLRGDRDSRSPADGILPAVTFSDSRSPDTIIQISEPPQIVERDLDVNEGERELAQIRDPGQSGHQEGTPNQIFQIQEQTSLNAKLDWFAKWCEEKHVVLFMAILEGITLSIRLPKENVFGKFWDPPDQFAKVGLGIESFIIGITILICVNQLFSLRKYVFMIALGVGALRLFSAVDLVTLFVICGCSVLLTAVRLYGYWKCRVPAHVTTSPRNAAQSN